VRRLGIDIGGTKTLCVVVDDSNGELSVVDERRVPTDPNADAATTIIGLATSFAGVDSLGVGIAGLVARDGSVAVTTHLPGVHDLPLGRRLATTLGIPVEIDNDATCATVAEWRFGAGRGEDNVLMVTIGTGIGGGAIINGRVARGSHGFAGEYGHIVVQRGGLACPCGRHGCWEAYVSGRGLAHIAGAPSSEAVLDAHVAGDPAASRAVGEFADWAALGLHNLVNSFDPACIVLGGGLGSRAEIVTAVHERFLAGERSHLGRALPRIVAAQLGEHAGAIGAALVGAGV